MNFVAVVSQAWLMQEGLPQKMQWNLLGPRKEEPEARWGKDGKRADDPLGKEREELEAADEEVVVEEEARARGTAELKPLILAPSIT